MADRIHLRLTIGGDYVPNTLPGEIWETNVRLVLVAGDVDDIGEIPDNLSVVAQPVARTESDWTISGNWKIENAPATFSPDDYLNDQVAPAVTDWLLNVNCSNQVRARYLKLLPCKNPLGRGVAAPGYAQATPMTLEWTGAYPIGNQSSTQLPPQNSVVVSHRTGQVGARGRGRMFLPPATSAVLSGARIASTPQQDILDAHTDFLIGLGYTAPVVGNFNVRPVVTGAPFVEYAKITSIRVGNVMDTQRRRRNALQEVYLQGPVVYV
jgi:hypothetical protein